MSDPCASASQQQQQPQTSTDAAHLAVDDDDGDGSVNIITSDLISEPKRKRSRLTKKLHVAIAGCSHGEMDKIYATLAEIERQSNKKFDLLISCGDYQAARNYGDLKHMHVSMKYRMLHTFYRYYSGEVKAPILTLFIGGNHEASGFLQEIPNGGWVAPNIYYMGHANVVQFAGLRIAGLSGIFNKHHYNIGHWERPPFLQSGGIVSAYHVRSVDVFRLKQLRRTNADDKRIDIMISHDWPAGITDYGSVARLLQQKPFFHEDIEKNRLGNPATMALIHDLRPRYWFAAHLHCKFAALVPHVNADEQQNTDEIELTRFLSLDKPLPRRHFLQALEFDVDEDAQLKLSYDPVWLAILRSTDSLTDVSKCTSYMPSQHSAGNDERWDYTPTEEELKEVHRLFEGDFTVPQNFRRTAPPHDPQNIDDTEFYYRNPQSTEFCAKLKIRDMNEMLCAQSREALGVPYFLSENSLDSTTETKQSMNDAGAQLKDELLVPEGCDFVIDRGRRASPIHITNNDTVSKESANDEQQKGDSEPLAEHSTSNKSTESSDVVEGRETNEIQSRQLRVGSGVFRRRPVDLPQDEEPD